MQLYLADGFIPQVDDPFLIVDNRGTNSVLGTFSGLPEGATITANGTSFRITYTGGTGNDVVLTVVGQQSTRTGIAAATTGDILLNGYYINSEPHVLNGESAYDDTRHSACRDQCANAQTAVLYEFGLDEKAGAFDYMQPDLLDVLVDRRLDEDQHDLAEIDEAFASVGDFYNCRWR